MNPKRILSVLFVALLLTACGAEAQDVPDYRTMVAASVWEGSSVEVVGFLEFQEYTVYRMVDGPVGALYAGNVCYIVVKRSGLSSPSLWCK